MQFGRSWQETRHAASLPVMIDCAASDKTVLLENNIPNAGWETHA